MYTSKSRNFAFPAMRASQFFNQFNNREMGERKPWDGKTLPSANVKETAENFTIEMAVPGMNKTDFTIRIEKDVLVVASQNKHEDLKETENFTRKEFDYNAFSRSFSIPESVDSDAILATYENGILKLVLPKKSEVTKNKLRKIEVM